jgi:hypothetical protein
MVIFPQLTLGFLIQRATSGGKICNRTQSHKLTSVAQCVQRDTDKLTPSQVDPVAPVVKPMVSQERSEQTDRHLLVSPNKEIKTIFPTETQHKL